MKKGTLLLLAISLIFCSVTYGQNVIGNPGFEDLTPSFWNPLNGTFGSELGVGTDVGDNVKTGFRSFKITKSAATSDIVGWLSDDNANKYWNNAGSGTFSIQAAIKTVGVNTNPADDDSKIGVMFVFKNAAGAELATATIYADQSVASKDWEDLSDVVILGSETPEEIYVTLFMGKNATGTVYFDNVDCNTADSWTMGVFNSGAEDVAGWMDWYGGDGNYAKITDEEAHSGNYSVVMYQDDDPETNQSELVYYSQPYPIEAGEWYKISAWVKTEKVPDIGKGEFTYASSDYYDGGINICFFTHGGNIDTEWSAQGDRFIYVDQRDSTTEWRLYEAVHKASDEATGISVRARFNNHVTGTAWFDDFSVEKIVEVGDNVIGNPGLEDLTPSFWNPLNGIFGSELGVGTDVGDNVKTGFRSFKITKSAATSDIVGWLSDDNANKYWNNAGSGTFSIQAAIKTVGVNTNPADDDSKIGVMFVFKNAAGAELATATIYADQSVASKDWEDLSDVVILGSETPEEIYVTLFMGKNATGTVYFDNVDCNTADSWTMGVFNSGAEDVAGWMDWYGGDGNYTVVSDVETHSGTYAIEMYQDDDPETNQSELVYYSQPYPIEAGEWYKIGVWVKTEKVPNIGVGEFTYPTGDYHDGGINLCFFTHGGNIDTEWSAQGDRFIYVDQRDSTTEWRLYEGVHKASDEATGISVRARFNNHVTGTAWFDDFSVVKMSVVTSSIEPRDNDDIEIPKTYALLQNYPNPFNPQTTIEYQLPAQTRVDMVVYNVMGQKVKTLVNSVQNAGNYSIVWDARNDHGNLVSSGVYFCVLKTNEQRLTSKMILMR